MKMSDNEKILKHMFDGIDIMTLSLAYDKYIECFDWTDYENSPTPKASKNSLCAIFLKECCDKKLISQRYEYLQLSRTNYYTISKKLKRKITLNELLDEED